MVKVVPLNGIIYNQEKINIADVIAPPYDVISAEEQENLYNKSAFNIVRLILGKINSEDNESENRYTRAAKYFQDWLEEKALIKPEKPCIYYYIQNYTTSRGEKISRKGFIAGNLIEEYEKGNIMPHEFTMGGPKEDRLKLMKACKANFSQVFFAYSDPEGEVDKAFKLPAKPIIDLTDNQGIQNILYAIEDTEVINKISEIMSAKKVLIADGHHRYETSIAYRNFRREEKKLWDENSPFNFVMAYYTNLDDENLKVFPTHRIVERAIDKNALLENMAKYFDKSEYKFDEVTREDVKERFVNDIEESAKTKISFGACFKDENKYILFKLREKEAVDKMLEEKGVPEVLRKLDLSLLHKIVLSDFLEFSEEDQIKQNGVKYLKKEAEAFEAVEKGLPANEFALQTGETSSADLSRSSKAEAVFIMATPSIQLIKDVSSQGYKMPQKSTYFYPKLLSGLVINPLD